MTTFSEKYGYVTFRTAVFREDMPAEVMNAVYSCFDDLRSRYDDNMRYNYLF